jgi:hypothetical protein
VSFRAVFVGLVLGLAAAYWYFKASLPQLVVPDSVAGVDAGGASVAQAPATVEVEPLEPDASLPPPAAGVTFDDGFCAASGGEGFRIHATLEAALVNELRRRLKTDASEERDTPLLREVAGTWRPRELYEHAKLAAAESPDSPWPQIALALAARDLELPDEQVLALRRARERRPSDPAIGFALAAATWFGPDLDEAIDGLGTYLAVEPSPGASRMRARLEVQRDIQKGYRREQRDGITALWPDSMSSTQADEIIRLVDRGLDDAAALSGTTRRKTLTLVVYPSRSELLAVACVRNWTAALYDGVLRVVADGPDADVDRAVLRHETLHAQVSPIATKAPKWFHEGLAQSFSQERKPKRTWKLMVKNRSWVPFTSLDGSFQEFAATADADLAYAQSYAMVEMMRELGTDAAVRTAIASFQAGVSTPDTIAKACGKPEVTGADLLGFIERKLAE